MKRLGRHGVCWAQEGSRPQTVWCCPVIYHWSQWERPPITSAEQNSSSPEDVFQAQVSLSCSWWIGTKSFDFSFFFSFCRPLCISITIPRFSIRQHHRLNTRTRLNDYYSENKNLTKKKKKTRRGRAKTPPRFALLSPRWTTLLLWDRFFPLLFFIWLLLRCWCCHGAFWETLLGNFRCSSFILSSCRLSWQVIASTFSFSFAIHTDRNIFVCTWNNTGHAGRVHNFPNGLSAFQTKCT